MNRESVADEVRSIVELVVGRLPGGEAPSDRASTPGWDSLKQVEIVFLLEDRFGVRFTEEEIATLDSVDRIARSLEGRIAPRPPN